MRRIDRRILAVPLILSMALSMAGCQRKEESVQEDAETDGVSYDAIEDGKYYVVSSDGTYHPLSFKNASFDTSSSSSSTEERVLWYAEDEYADIPTLYAGDMIVYKKDESFDEAFEFERFYYDGYTVGI